MYKPWWERETVHYLSKSVDEQRQIVWTKAGLSGSLLEAVEQVRQAWPESVEYKPIGDKVEFSYAAFVAAMEDLLEVYHLPYGPDFPVDAWTSPAGNWLVKYELQFLASPVSLCALAMSMSEMGLHRFLWTLSPWLEEGGDHYRTKNQKGLGTPDQRDA